MFMVKLDGMKVRGFQDEESAYEWVKVLRRHSCGAISVSMYSECEMPRAEKGRRLRFDNRSIFDGGVSIRMGCV